LARGRAVSPTSATAPRTLLAAAPPTRHDGAETYAARVDERVAQNRANWDDRVAVHLASAFYDVDGWLARAPGPRDAELEALGDLAGRSLVQLQCHFGMDALQFARVGARVVGVDFSAPAIDAARELAARAGLSDRSRFVCGDVTDAPGLLGGERFDVAYVSLGSLCWLPSVAAWADAVAGVLAPGGTLYLFDVHPLAQCLDDEGERVAHPYFESRDGQRDDYEYTYTDGAVPPLPLARRGGAAPLHVPPAAPARAAHDDRRGRRHLVAGGARISPTNHGTARTGG
jgi:SAM-dependent methyltransferase